MVRFGAIRLAVNLGKRPWWSWIVAGVAFVVIREFAKAGMAKAVVDKMGRERVANYDLSD
jgi:hypothetical protein